MCAIGGLLIAAGFFMNGYSIIANANGFRSGTANSGEVTDGLLIVDYLLLKSALCKQDDSHGQRTAQFLNYYQTR